MYQPLSPQEKRLSDLHVVQTQTLPAPSQLCAQIFLTDEEVQFVERSRKQIQDILYGRDQRFLLIVGPCSIHDPKACKEYASRLLELAEEVKDTVLLVMRVYFEKPRTTVGWKGLIMDPYLDDSHNIPEGLRMARTILRDMIAMGLPTATELLDPITPQYTSDLICWSAIGARTTESQTHRQMASGLSMPVGFKNGTNGSLVPAINAIGAGTQPQTFLGVDHHGLASAVSTTGNPDCHIILRGGEDGPNYQAEHVARSVEALQAANLPDAVMVDASHANCKKNYALMPDVYRDIIAQRAAGQTRLVGAMLESNLVAGHQKFPQPLDDLVYGQSITDSCIDWETTVQLVRETVSVLR